MADLFPIVYAQDAVLRLPSLFPSSLVEAGETFGAGEPLTLNTAGRMIRASNNPLDVIAISRQPVTGLAGGTGFRATQLGDGTLWTWGCPRLARDGAGTVVTPVASDVGDKAGLIRVGGQWIVDTGLSNKVVEIIGFSPTRVEIRFLRVTTSQLVAAGAIVFESELVSFTEVTPGDIITTGAFGAMRERIHQIGDISGGGSFTPATDLFNKFRFRPIGSTVTINNPTVEPANDESMTLTFHIVSDGTPRTVAVGTKFQLVGGTTSFATTSVAGEELILSCSWNGTDWRCVLSGATA